LADPTDSLEVFTGAVFDLVVANKVALGVVDVFYSDQWRVPRTPSICVQASRKNREVVGAPRRIRNTFETFILIYHSKVTEIQESARDVDVMADDLEALVHADLTFGGLVTTSMVVLNESGYRPKPDTLFRGVRLTVQGQSTTYLPMAPGYNQP
jgi:hypothetical protein